MSHSQYIDAAPASEPGYNNNSHNLSNHEISGITIIAQPIDVSGKIGAYVNMSANILANNPKYQWYDKYGVPMSRMRQSNLTIGPIKEEDFGFYCLEIKDEAANREVTRWVELKKSQPRVQTQPINYSQQAVVQGKLKPMLVKAPDGGEYTRGNKITLTAYFENATHYQWYKDGEKLEGCVWDTLIINNANRGNTGDYDLFVSNGTDVGSVKTKVIVY